MTAGSTDYCRETDIAGTPVLINDMGARERHLS